MQYLLKQHNEFCKMGACNCKKRKLKSVDMSLLPSKITVKQLMKVNKKKNDLNVDAEGENKQSRNDKQDTTCKVQSSSTDKIIEENEYDQQPHLSNSSSRIMKINNSPKIIVHQNIIIKSPYWERQEDDDTDTNKNSVEDVMKSTENRKYISNCTEFKFNGHFSDNIQYINMTEEITVEANECKIYKKCEIENKNSFCSRYIVCNKENENLISTVNSNLISEANNSNFHSDNKTPPGFTNVQQNEDESNEKKNVSKNENILQSKSTKEIKNLQPVKGAAGTVYTGCSNEQEIEESEFDLSTSSLTSFLNKAHFFDSILNETLSHNNNSDCSTSIYIGLIAAEISATKQSVNRGVTKSYIEYISNTEYLTDIFKHIRTIENDTVLNNDFLSNYGHDDLDRAGIVNWMLQKQAKLDFSESEFYIAVHLFDKVLSKTHVPDYYESKLTAIATIWISTKLMGSFNIQKASTMLRKMEENRYTAEELVAKEQFIIRLVNFHVYSLEPSVCISYYIKMLDLQHETVTNLAATYALDILTLLPEFSSTRTSLAAAAAVDFVQGIFNQGSQLKVYQFFLETFSISEIESIKSLEVLLYIQLKNMSDINYLFKAPYNKHALLSASEHMSVKV